MLDVLFCCIFCLNIYYYRGVAYANKVELHVGPDLLR